MTAFVFVVIYAGAAIFVVATTVRAWRYARMPLHLRWELYPVPHERSDRAGHGGSYFEVGDWWTVPSRPNRLGELAAMIPEMLVLRGLWEYNRALWFRSFPFHFGLYLLLAAAMLLMAAAGLNVWVAAPLPGAAAGWLSGLAALSAGAGAPLAIGGAIGLLHRRLRHPDLRPYTVPADLFNLSFFIVALGALAAGVLFRPAGSASGLELASALLGFDTAAPLPVPLAVGLVLAAALVAYVPLTHMAHFVGKYFTYHAVRWDDRPGVHDVRVRRRVAELLTFRPTWSAPHVGADGRRTWAEVASSTPPRGARR